MSGSDAPYHSSRGFALIVVLSALAILTLLFAISTRLSIAHIQRQNTELLIAERSFQNGEIVNAALVALASADRAHGLPDKVEVQVNGESVTVEVIDVGGLVDLNTADPRLLQATFEALGLGPDELARYRDWRRYGRRLLQVDDLIRITGSQGIDRRLLRRITTVHSGRRGVSEQDAPARLLEALSGRIALVDFASAPSGVNVALFVTDPSSSVIRYVGVAHAPLDLDTSRLLAVY